MVFIRLVWFLVVLFKWIVNSFLLKCVLTLEFKIVVVGVDVVFK